jgi:hypothetical protein
MKNVAKVPSISIAKLRTIHLKMFKWLLNSIVIKTELLQSNDFNKTEIV